MALLKTPDGGFYVSSDDFNVDYVENSITLVQQGGSGTSGVTSFNGRTGVVIPADGDYTADQVGARPDTWTPSADDVGALSNFRRHSYRANYTFWKSNAR